MRERPILFSGPMVRAILRRAEDALDQHGKARYIKRDLEAFREVPA